MTIKKLFILFLALVTLVCFAACAEENDGNKINVDPNDPFTGEWKESTMEGFETRYTFNGDGTGWQSVLDIDTELRYTYDDDTITISLYVENPPRVYEYSYKIEGNQLKLTLANADGTVTGVFTKQ